jgi:subtilase family serine protease
MALAACNSGGSTTSVPLSAARAPVQSIATSGDFGSSYVLPSNVQHVCPQVSYGYMRCTSLARTDTNPSTPSGYGPADLQAAYNLPSGTNGTGQTIAIVDAFDDPNAESDLGVYRSTFGETACTTANGCFMKVNQRGQQGHYPKGNTGWGAEMSLDLDMVSAGCPNCHIILVEGNNNTAKSLGESVDEAVTLGANVVTNSYSGSGGDVKYYDHPGHIILASSGDSGYGIADPASFASVISVGGTTLQKGGSGRGWTETVWSGTGGGCSTRNKPPWQHDVGCKNRTSNDASAVANPGTGVAVYDTYGGGGWQVYGGTSVSSPLLASVYGLAGNANTLHAAASLWLHKNHQYLYDITSGQDGTCTPTYLCEARVGYDGPTGWGTPNGIGAF